MTDHAPDPNRPVPAHSSSAEERPEPSAAELEAMAYADGELTGGALTDFETRLASDPALGREVARLKALSLLACRSAPPEPMDHEWARLAGDPVQRAGLGFGALAVLSASVGLLGWLVYAIATDPELHGIPKALLLLGTAGFGTWFLAILRGRLRTRSLDPYTSIHR